MSSPIGPGDWVVCVSVVPRDPEVDIGHPVFELGQTYTVEACGVWMGHPFLVIAGMHSPHPSRGYLAEAFRKIDRISDEFRKVLLTPVPLDVEPLVEA